MAGSTARSSISTDSTYSVADRAVALHGALESITLLKNEGHLLPLDAAKIKTIAIIGPDAWPAVPGGGGSSQATAFDPVSIVTGIAKLVGPDVHVLYTRGLPEMNDVFWQYALGRRRTGGHVSQQGLFRNAGDGQPAAAIANYKEEWWGPEDKTPRSIRYTAAFKAGKAGKYLMLPRPRAAITTRSASTAKRFSNRPRSRGSIPSQRPSSSHAGQTVKVVADYLPGVCRQSIRPRHRRMKPK